MPSNHSHASSMCCLGAFCWVDPRYHNFPNIFPWQLEKTIAAGTAPGKTNLGVFLGKTAYFIISYPTHQLRTLQNCCNKKCEHVWCLGGGFLLVTHTQIPLTFSTHDTLTSYRGRINTLTLWLALYTIVPKLYNKRWFNIFDVARIAIKCKHKSLWLFLLMTPWHHTEVVLTLLHFDWLYIHTVFKYKYKYKYIYIHMHDACFILIENRDKTAPVCFFHASTSIDFFHQCEIDQTDRQTWEPDTFSFPSEPEKNTCDIPLNPGCLRGILRTAYYIPIYNWVYIIPCIYIYNIYIYTLNNQSSFFSLLNRVCKTYNKIKKGNDTRLNI